MTERTLPLTMTITLKKCDKCEEGKLQATGHMIPLKEGEKPNMNTYTHSCSSCKQVTTFDKQYPFTLYHFDEKEVQHVDPSGTVPETIN